MLNKTYSRYHFSFISLVTLLTSIILASSLVKIISLYFPFSNPNFFSSIHLSWNKVAYLAILMSIPPYAWFAWRFLYLHTRPSKSIIILLRVMSGISLLLLIYVVSKLDLSLFYHWTPDKVVTYTDLRTFLLSLLSLRLVSLSYRYGKFNSGFLSTTAAKVILGAIVLIALYLANFALLTDNHRYNANALNFSVVMHPVVQVFYGKAVLIDMKTQYGLYAQFLEPIFHVLGGISVFKFSLVMSALILTSMLAIGIFLFISVNPILALIGFCATLYFNYFAGTLWPYELYYQYYPIRTIVPTLTLLLSWFYFRAPSKKKFINMLIFLSIGILWNLDVGVFALLAFVSATSYQILFQQKQALHKLRRLISTWLQVAIVLSAVFTSFILYLRLRYHIWPTISELTSAQKLFLSGAVLSLDRLWIIVALIYLAGLVTSVKNLVLRRHSVNHIMILLTTILGVGVFTYSLNNPHDAVLTNSGYPSIILLTLLTHEALSEWFKLRNPFHWKSIYHYKFGIISLTLLSFLGASFFVNLKNSQVVRDTVVIQDLLDPQPGDIRAVWATKGASDTITAYTTLGDLSKNPAISPVWMNKVDFVSRYALPNGVIRDDLLILSNWDYLLYLKANAKSPLISVNFRHLYLENEWQLLFDQVESKQSNLIIADVAWGLFKGELKNHPNKHIAILENLIHTHYHPIETEVVGDSWYLDRWYPNEMIVYERN